MSEKKAQKAITSYGQIKKSARETFKPAVVQPSSKALSKRKAEPVDIDSLDAEAIEQELRKFDLDLEFGPCAGFSRQERWDRAKSLGLNPPEAIRILLQESHLSAKQNESLWDQDYQL